MSVILVAIASPEVPVSQRINSIKSSCICPFVSMKRKIRGNCSLVETSTASSAHTLMHVHYTTEIDLEEVINIFSCQHPCCMLVEDTLH